ncbi:MAG: hypothetical protein ACK5A0_03450, partial [Polaromonas sp.]
GGAGDQIPPALIAEAHPREIELRVGSGRRLGQDQGRGEGHCQGGCTLLDEGASGCGVNAGRLAG